MKKLATLAGIAICTMLIASTVCAQLSGTYYIGAAGTGPGGSDPGYATLKAACDALNANSGANIQGDCTFLITSNLTEAANVGLGLNTNGHTITFKPYTSVTPTITFTSTTDNAGASGAWVLGVPDLTVTSATNYGLVTTENIIIDGSNTNGGTTRDMTLATTSSANVNTVVLRIFGDCNNITVKNCVVNQAYSSTSSSSNYGLALINRYNSTNTTYYVPDNVTIDNCDITANGSPSAQALAISNSGTISGTAWPGTTGIIFRNNKVTGRQRGIFLNYAGSTNIYGNEIRVNQTSSGYLSYGIMPNQIATSVASTLNVYNNKITQLSTANAALGSYGIIGIYVGVAGTWNVYNNTIAGFATTTSTTDPSIARVWGIQVATVTANVFFNTVYLPDITYTVSANNSLQLYTGIYLSSGTATVKNNIVVSAATSDTSYGIYNAGATLTSDYNNFYVPGLGGNGFVGYGASTRYPTLTDWKGSAGSPDANSKSVAVTFTSATDLHLAGGSNGDVNLIGVTGLGISTDIDGDARSGSFPYMGADEASTLLPVELAGFTASSRGNSVELAWKTATEVNNYGFDIERKASNREWVKVGFVEGKGTTNAPQNYSFRENLTSSGKYAYRLKQIDRNGEFSYSNEVEAVVGLAPEEYTLTQNYPNPFNPSTTIRFALKTSGHASLKVFNTAGQEVKALFDDVAEAGRVYSVVFDGTGLASGTYFYVLQTPDKREVKKMLMMK